MPRDYRGATTAQGPASDADWGYGPLASLYLHPSMLAVPDKSSLSGRMFTMVELAGCDHPSGLGQGRDVLRRRLKPLRHRSIVPSSDLARLARYRGFMSGFNPCRSRRKQMPYQFPMIRDEDPFRRRPGKSTAR